MDLSRYLRKLRNLAFSLILLITIDSCASAPAPSSDTRGMETLAPGGPLTGEMQIRFPLSLPREEKKVGSPGEKSR